MDFSQTLDGWLGLQSFSLGVGWGGVRELSSARNYVWNSKYFHVVVTHTFFWMLCLVVPLFVYTKGYKGYTFSIHHPCFLTGIGLKILSQGQDILALFYGRMRNAMI
jgi:hypothetical protein